MLQDFDVENKLTEYAPKSYGTLKDAVSENEIENNEPRLIPVRLLVVVTNHKNLFYQLGTYTIMILSYFS